MYRGASTLHAGLDIQGSCPGLSSETPLGRRENVMYKSWLSSRQCQASETGSASAFSATQSVPNVHLDSGEEPCGYSSDADSHASANFLAPKRLRALRVRSNSRR